MNRIDLTGLKFGRLTALSCVGRKNGGMFWLCRCACGVSKQIRSISLRSGDTRSCGCLVRETSRENIKVAQRNQTTHGHSGTLIYGIWMNMHQRCENPNHISYRHYGARGITVCGRWKLFANFLTDMGEKPLNRTLHRLNNDLGYNPSNCKWATRTEQNKKGARRPRTCPHCGGLLGIRRIHKLKMLKLKNAA